MKLLKTGISALSLTAMATVGLAADYEIFDDFMSVATGESHYSVERLDQDGTCREGYQTFLAACQCLAPGRSTRPPEKPSSVLQTPLSAWT